MRGSAQLANERHHVDGTGSYLVSGKLVARFTLLGRLGDRLRRGGRWPPSWGKAAGRAVAALGG